MTAPDRRPLPQLPPLASIRRVHVIGMCGTAMAPLAAMFRERGYAVSGSDAAAYPPMSTWLADRGLELRSGYAAEHIPADTDLVVVGNVARRDNPEVQAAAARNIPSISLPEALRVAFFPHRRVLCVTGTHGKTTTSSMAAWLLFAAGRDPSFFIGGVTANFGANYRLGDGPDFVVEGDEYDTAWFDKVPKYWHYPATAATINNVEYDHADIYPDMDAVRHVFARFAAQIPADGVLWINGDDHEARRAAAAAQCEVRTFGLADSNDLAARVLSVGEDGTRCEVRADDRILDVTIPMIGEHNVRNFLGALGLVGRAGVDAEACCEAIARFRGVKKRQEIKGTADGVVVIDDFAHHPTAVFETLRAIRARYPSRRLWVAFEAKSNTSRRAVFQDAFAAAFDPADAVVLSQPWKKDDLPDEQLLSLPRLADDIAARGKDVQLIPDVDAIVEALAARVTQGDVVVGLSGSAFGGLHDKLLQRLAER